jgi:hypothetical protein
MGKSRRDHKSLKPGLELGMGINSPNDIHEPLTWNGPTHIPSINERAQISTTRRKVKVTLPKLKFMEDDYEKT